MGAYLRTFALFVLLTGIFVVFGWILGSLWFGATNGILLFLVLAAAMNAISYFASDRIVLWSYRAKLVTEAEAPDLFEVQEDGSLLVLNFRPVSDQRELLEAAVDSCPTAALSIVED